MGHVMEKMNGIMHFESLHHGITIEVGWFLVQLGEIMEGLGFEFMVFSELITSFHTICA
jgi:hypothetical protein